ncbi:hypothetical protein, partial [Salmonella enterica]
PVPGSVCVPPAVSVNAIGGGSIYSTNREARLSPKNYGCQKTRQTLSDQPGKDNFLFFKRLRTRQDVPKLKFGSSDWMLFCIYLIEFKLILFLKLK